MGTRLTQNTEAIDLALYLKKQKTLVLGDIHLGYEEHLARGGVLVPRTQFKQTIERLEKILAQVNPEVIVLNGDVKHEFGSVNPQEWREVLKLIDYLKRKCKKIVVIKGNHDTILGPIAKKRDIEEVKEYRTGNTLVIHGDYEPEKTAETIIMGHEHPAITLRDEAKAEKYKCYLKGKYKGKTLIVMPSFLTLTSGTDITREKLISPLLKKGVEDFECYVVDDETREVLRFGRVGNIG